MVTVKQFIAMCIGAGAFSVTSYLIFLGFLGVL